MSVNPNSIADTSYQQVAELQRNYQLQQINEGDEKIPSPSSLHAYNGQHEINWSEILDSLKSKQPHKILSALQTVRSTLSPTQDSSLMIDTVIQSGVIPLCVDILDAGNDTELQHEAAWILTNIAAGSTEQTTSVLKAVPKLVVLMTSSVEKVAKQAVWALANIASDVPEFKHYIQQFKVVDILLKQNLDKMMDSYLSIVVYLLKGLCFFKERFMSLEKVGPLIPILIKLLQNEAEDILFNALQAIIDLTEGIEGIDLIMDAGVAPRLVRLLDSNSTIIVKKSLKVICNIVCATDEQTSKMLETGVLQQLQRLLEHNESLINKDAAHAISNICDGTHEQIDQVLASEVLFTIERLLRLHEHPSHKDALWAITNIITRGTKEQVIKLIDTSSVIKLYCNHLEHHEENVLTGIRGLFLIAEEIGTTETKSFRLFMTEIGALDRLLVLLRHESEEIRSDALNLFDKYFIGETRGLNFL